MRHLSVLILAACSTFHTGERTDFVSVSAGLYTTCALDTESLVTCWGDGPLPTGDEAFEALATGQRQFCGIRTDGTSPCWPEETGPFVDISYGWNGHCGTLADGRVLCGGDVSGPPLFESPRSHRFVQADKDILGACGVADDGEAACWQSEPNASPIAVGSGVDHLAIAQALCLLQDGVVTCQQPPGGIEGGGGRQMPAGYGLTGSFETISGSSGGALCGLTTAGQARCTGYVHANASWATTFEGEQRVDFGEILPTDDFTQVSAGYAHACGVLTDGRVQCWGFDRTGELLPP